jgi:23S rRNA pseudouridine1911/1915/1917 synthase
MTEFTVSRDEDGRRLDVVLAVRSGRSRASAQRAVAAGLVTVDGGPAAKRQLLTSGQKVAYEVPVASGAGIEAEPVPYTLVYEDDWLLVVDKPAGVVVHPAPGHEHGTLVHGLVERGVAGGHESRPGIVHRLDRDTSGLLIVARTAIAHRRLIESMARRDISRRYVTLVCGAPPAEDGVIDVPIGRHVRDRKRMSVHTARGRPAVTHFSVRERLDDYTLLDVRLETGRTHQIRVHLAALGCPVAGDPVYGRRERPPGLERQFLHAARLGVPHPDSGEELEFESPLPEDLTSFLAACRRTAKPPQ